MMNNKRPCTLFLSALIICTLTWEFPLGEGSRELDNEKDVKVIFYPSLDGRMVYDFYREGSDKKAVPQERAGDFEGSGEKEVDVIFHPSFDGHVIFNHLRMGEHNSTEVSTPVADTVAGEKCVPSKVCFGDSDCNGGSCLGIAVGKCSCGACVSLLSCKDDSACGGLIGACNNETSLCDCELGFKTHTIGSFFDALVSVCNVRDCVPNTDSCFGLPCNSGICACF